MATPKKPAVKVIDRKKKLPAYRSFRLSRRIKSRDIKTLPRSSELWKETLRFIWIHKKQFVVFLMIYSFAYAALVKGTSGFTFDMEYVKEELFIATSGNIEAIISFITIYASLISSLTATADEISNFYQTLIYVLFSLALIWLIRKQHSRIRNVTVKQSFYSGMTPLIPFLGVILILVLEMLPVVFGTTLLSSAYESDAIRSNTDILIFSIVFILTFILSVYLLAGSIFALYIVTIPGVGPLVAVRSSLQLLRIHRWRILLRVVRFYFELILLGFIAILPFIIWLPRYAEIAFFIMGSLSFGIMHVYMYKLYKSIL